MSEKKTLLQAVAKTAAFDLNAQIQSAAGRCAAYAVEGVSLLELQKNIARLTGYPVTGLLAAKQLLAEAAGESAAYPF